MKKASISMIIYTILSYILTIIIPKSEFVKEQKEMFILTPDKVLIYIIFVIIILSIIEGFILNSLNKKELKIMTILNVVVICLLLAILIVDSGRGIVIFLKYRFMVFSIISLSSLIISNYVIKEKNNEKENSQIK